MNKQDKANEQDRTKEKETNLYETSKENVQKGFSFVYRRLQFRC